MLSFLDIFPLSHGHTLVIPKEPAVTLDELIAHSMLDAGRAMAALTRLEVASRISRCEGGFVREEGLFPRGSNC